MTNGPGPPQEADKSLGEIVSEVSEKASLLVREEIELAKAEVKEKVTKLTKGAVVGIVAGVVLVFALLVFLHALAWFFVDLFNFESIWPGFLLVFVLLVVVAAIAGWLAARWLKGGSPPTPDLAIEEAKRTREDLEQQVAEHDQLERGKVEA